MKAAQNLIQRHIGPNGSFPNNEKLPLIIVQETLRGTDITHLNFEKIFTSNSWPAAWRNGLFGFHHFHSNAHEVLGVYSGWVKACFGGPGGEIIEAKAGDVIIIPAGVSHCNKGESSDFKVVGGYPAGQRWDMMQGSPEQLSQALENIANVPLPLTDPVSGDNGPIIKLWSS